MNRTITPLAPADFLKLLAHDLRWQLLTALSRSDHRVHELVTHLNQPMNLVSYHLKRLRDHHLVTEHRSAADGRDIYYSLDIETLRNHYVTAGEALHPALAEGATTPQAHVSRDIEPIARVLFLCTHNSARSQMAEGILRHLSGGRVEAYSAGSDPTSIHPYAVRALAALGIDSGQQQAKHLDTFRGQTFSYIVTVCDRVREVCPTFPDDPDRIHWSVPDPISGEGDAEGQFRVFTLTAQELVTRIRYLLTLIDREKGKAA